jgi:hypothetical protein
MKRSSIANYTSDWPMVSKRVKDEAGWKCVRCGHAHDIETGHVLTVHHLDMNPSNNRWWNTVALCQRCHLHVQGKVILERLFMFEHSEWFKPYVAGYYAFMNNLPDDRDFVLRNTDQLLDFGRPFPKYPALTAQ